MKHTEAANAVVTALRRVNKRIATAESCTGGLVAAAITSISGSSNVFEYGIIAYANYVKAAQLSVPDDVLRDYGAVSAETAGFLAEGARKKGNAHYGIGVTGIAGPGGATGTGTEEKPVGLVYVAVAREGTIICKELRLLEACGNDREAIRNAAVGEALQLALHAITTDKSPRV